MLKTSLSIDLSTNSTQIVFEYDEIDDDSDSNGDFDKKCWSDASKLIYFPTPLNSIFKISESTDSSTSST